MTDLPLVKTTDINLASYLLCIGFAIMGIDNQIPKRATFYFKKSPELMQRINAYWDKSLKIIPLDLSHARKEILSRVYQNAGSKKRQPEQS